MTGIREKMWLIIAAFLAVCLITGIVFFCIRLSQSPAHRDNPERRPGRPISAATYI